MTQDEIIRMAREAGFTDIEATALEYFYQAAFAAGAAHEREACAKVCKQVAKNCSINNYPAALECASAIYQRGKK